MRDSRRVDTSARPARGRRAANAPSFISHASADERFVTVIDRALQTDKLKTWVDRSDIRFGALLRDQLLEAIRGSRALVLVWSKAAFKSRWVTAEIFMAYYLDRFIIPCALDATSLPQFLANSVYLDRRREKHRLLQELGRAVRTAPAGANMPAAVMVSETADLQAWIDRVGRAQYDVVGNSEKSQAGRPSAGAQPRGLSMQEHLHAQARPGDPGGPRAERPAPAKGRALFLLEPVC
jgi:TIR domain